MCQFSGSARPVPAFGVPTKTTRPNRRPPRLAGEDEFDEAPVHEPAPAVRHDVDVRRVLADGVEAAQQVLRVRLRIDAERGVVEAEHGVVRPVRFAEEVLPPRIRDERAVRPGRAAERAVDEEEQPRRAIRRQAEPVEPVEPPPLRRVAAVHHEEARLDVLLQRAHRLRRRLLRDEPEDVELGLVEDFVEDEVFDEPARRPLRRSPRCRRELDGEPYLTRSRAPAAAARPCRCRRRVRQLPRIHPVLLDEDDGLFVAAERHVHGDVLRSRRSRAAPRRRRTGGGEVEARHGEALLLERGGDGARLGPVIARGTGRARQRAGGVATAPASAATGGRSGGRFVVGGERDADAALVLDDGRHDFSGFRSGRADGEIHRSILQKTIARATAVTSVPFARISTERSRYIDAAFPLLRYPDEANAPLPESE